METVSLTLIALALVGIGCAGTILSAFVVPLAIRVRGQPHGRYAWLSAATESSDARGAGRKIGGTGVASDVQEAPGLIVA